MEPVQGLIPYDVSIVDGCKAGRGELVSSLRETIANVATNGSVSLAAPLHDTHISKSTGPPEGSRGGG